MTNILQEYLTYLRTGRKPDTYSNEDFMEYLEGNGSKQLPVTAYTGKHRKCTSKCFF